MSEPRHRKLAAMGMASLVSTGRHEVLDRLPTEICNLWLDVLCEIREAQIAEEEGCVPRSSLHCTMADGRATHSGPETLYLYWDKPPTSFYRDTEGTPEYARREAVRPPLQISSRRTLTDGHHAELPKRPSAHDAAHDLHPGVPRRGGGGRRRARGAAGAVPREGGPDGARADPGGADGAARAPVRRRVMAAIGH